MTLKVLDSENTLAFVDHGPTQDDGPLVEVDIVKHQTAQFAATTSDSDFGEQVITEGRVPLVAPLHEPLDIIEGREVDMCLGRLDGLRSGSNIAVKPFVDDGTLQGVVAEPVNLLHEVLG